ncbi:MAG: major facilitator superfamily 1 [Eubacterium sp.]|jgi:MFS family permease|nr:major facilitator superfamily 1 [Eubacterium sp.]
MNKIKNFYGMKSFIILWAGESVSALGSALTKFALILWAYQQQGTASSVAFLSVFTYLPSILLCFAAGTLADRWDKKKILILSNLVAAIGTLSIFILFGTGCLRVWHLYIINFTLSFMAAFQNPAANVAVSMLAPKEKYVQASGMQAFTGSLVTIASPALGSALLALWGLNIIFLVDLFSFGIALFTLFFIHIPSIPIDESKKQESFLKSCLEGLYFLKKRRAILHLILFFSFINLLAYLTGFGILPAMILARSGNNQSVLGLVSSFIGIGTLVGSIIVTMTKPPNRKTRVIFLSLAVSFILANVLWAVGQNPFIWVLAAFSGNLPLPFITANMTTIMRTKVPAEMQGRVFSTRDTLQFFTIPIGLYLSGILSDKVFEPFMQNVSALQSFLSLLVGTGKGSGMAVMFLITGTVGFFASLLALKNPVYKELDL